MTIYNLLELTLLKKTMFVSKKEKMEGVSLKALRLSKMNPKNFWTSVFVILYTKKREFSIGLRIGGYRSFYEELAYFLHSKNEIIYVKLPQKVKYFAKSLNIKTNTDKVDAKLIADIGLERSSSLRSWNPPSEQFKAIRDLCREISQLKKINLQLPHAFTPGILLIIHCLRLFKLLKNTRTFLIM